MHLEVFLLSSLADSSVMDPLQYRMIVAISCALGAIIAIRTMDLGAAQASAFLDYSGNCVYIELAFGLVCRALLD